jgi:hypothetical protein
MRRRSHLAKVRRRRSLRNSYHRGAALRADRLDIIASAGHAEYGDPNPQNGLRLSIIWDPQADDLYEKIDGDEANAEALWEEYLGWRGIARPNADLTWENIWRLRGTREQVSEWLDSLLSDLSVTPSGDDTTYDYWPSGVRLAREVAAVLGRSDDVTAAVKSALDGTGIDADELGV